LSIEPCPPPFEAMRAPLLDDSSAQSWPTARLWRFLELVAVFCAGGGFLHYVGSLENDAPKDGATKLATEGNSSLVLPKKDPLGGVGAPLAKQVVLAMGNIISFHTEWDNWTAWSKEMAPYWTEDMIYDFGYVGSWNFGRAHGLREFFDNEHIHYNQALPDCQFTVLIRAGTETTCTVSAYGLARWMTPWAGVPPPASNPWVQVRNLDLYVMEGDKIKYNWCLVDVVDIFMQAGYNVLPPPPMATDGYLASKAMDGIPAPLSAKVDPKETAASEQVMRAALHEDYRLHAGNTRWLSESMIWYGPGGVGTAHSSLEYSTHWLRPLHAAFSNLTMAIDMVVCEGSYCGAHFYLHGSHTGPWLGEEATGKRVSIRCGAHARIETGKIQEGWMIVDFPLAFHTMGVDLFGRARELALAVS